MHREFIETLLFTKQWSDLGLTDNDLRILECRIAEMPDAAPLIEGTGGIRKIRIALPGRGRRGGGRVCYVDFALAESVYLITVYAKNEQETLSAEEKAVLRELVKRLKG